jgi:hypothetical protein
VGGGSLIPGLSTRLLHELKGLVPPEPAPHISFWPEYLQVRERAGGEKGAFSVVNKYDMPYRLQAGMQSGPEAAPQLSMVPRTFLFQTSTAMHA